MQLLLRGHGWDVRAYGSAETMLGDPQASDAVCLVADYRLAEIDGIELLRRLRARGWPGKALLITGFPSPELEAAARDVGYDQLLEKPFRELILPELIRRLIAGSPQ